MDDSIKGILVTLTIVGLFMSSILSFIIIFPEEQGVTFGNLEDQDNYLFINNTNIETIPRLTALQNQSNQAYNEWDVTTGFMGTNQIKQSQGGLTSLLTNTFDNFISLAKKVFGSEQNNAIVYALTIFSSLFGSYLIYMFYKFVRTGR